MTSPTVRGRWANWTILSDCAEPELGEVSAWSVVASRAMKEVAGLVPAFPAELSEKPEQGVRLLTSPALQAYR